MMNNTFKKVKIVLQNLLAEHFFLSFFLIEEMFFFFKQFFANE